MHLIQLTHKHNSTQPTLNMLRTHLGHIAYNWTLKNCMVLEAAGLG